MGSLALFVTGGDPLKHPHRDLLLLRGAHGCGSSDDPQIVSFALVHPTDAPLVLSLLKKEIARTVLPGIFDEMHVAFLSGSRLPSMVLICHLPTDFATYNFAYQTCIK